MSNLPNTLAAAIVLADATAILAAEDYTAHMEAARTANARRDFDTARAALITARAASQGRYDAATQAIHLRRQERETRRA